MENSSRRVSPHIQAVLDRFIEEKTKNPELNDCYQAYCRSHSFSRRHNEPKIPTYESLDALLASIQVTYREYMEAINLFPDYPVDWATEDQKKVAEALDQMDDAQCRKFRDLFWGYVPILVQDALKESEGIAGYGLRITNVMEAFANEGSACVRLYEKLGIEKRWRANKRPSYANITCPHEYMPAISAETGMPIHWMLNYGKPVLAGKESTEEAMDVFCFMPAGVQKMLADAITAVMLVGGV